MLLLTSAESILRLKNNKIFYGLTSLSLQFHAFHANGKQVDQNDSFMSDFLRTGSESSKVFTICTLQKWVDW